MKKKVMIGMSGGVDSSVAALLLLQQGYEVAGMTMALTGDSAIAQNDARRVCDKLGIQHFVVDFSDVFEKKVIDYFVQEYLSGKTPNPCVICNKKIKFGVMLENALSLGFDFIATGHYVCVERDPQSKRHLIYKSSSSKDQSYFLYNMTQHQLSHTLFPLGNTEKTQTRKLAQDFDLDVANKPDSQEICFVNNNDYVSFIKNFTKQNLITGNFQDLSGKILGKHQGILNYTVGQRKKLGITFNRPTYVLGIRKSDNVVVLGEEKDLYSSSLTVTNTNFIPFDNLDQPLTVQAKIRYQATPSTARVYKTNDGKIKVDFELAQRAVTPGQSVVFYKNDLLVGGGIIEAQYV